MRKFLGLAAVALTCAALSTGAHATVTIPNPTSFAFDTHAPAAGETLVNNFDGIFDPAFTFSGGTIRLGNTGAEAAKPFGDNTHYEAAEFGNSFHPAGPELKSLSFYVGSLDTYNTITFLGAGGYSQSLHRRALLVRLPTATQPARTPIASSSSPLTPATRSIRSFSPAASRPSKSTISMPCRRHGARARDLDHADPGLRLDRLHDAPSTRKERSDRGLNHEAQSSALIQSARAE